MNSDKLPTAGIVAVALSAYILLIIIILVIKYLTKNNCCTTEIHCCRGVHPVDDCLLCLGENLDYQVPNSQTCADTVCPTRQQEVTSKYLVPFWSVAMVFHVITIVAMVTLPAIVAFYTRNFWVTELVYTEQPRVTLQYEMVLVLTDTGGQQKTWSTYPVYNTLTQDFQTVPAISITETDHERDGIIDQYNITLQFKDDKIASIQGMFVFSYVLSDLCSLVMRVPLIIQKTVDGSSSVTVLGNMELLQNEILQSYTPNILYNTSVITLPNTLMSYDIPSILADVSTRAITVRYKEWYTYLTTSLNFTSSFIINIAAASVRYSPGFWEGVKYAWIQYLAIFFIFYQVISRFRGFVFENMIVTSLQSSPKIGPNTAAKAYGN